MLDLFFWIFCSSAEYNRRTKPLCLNHSLQSTSTGIVSIVCCSSCSECHKCLMRVLSMRTARVWLCTWHAECSTCVGTLSETVRGGTRPKIERLCNSKTKGRLYESDPFFEDVLHFLFHRSLYYVCSFSTTVIWSNTCYTIMDIQLWTPWRHTQLLFNTLHTNTASYIF